MRLHYLHLLNIIRLINLYVNKRNLIHSSSFKCKIIEEITHINIKSILTTTFKVAGTIFSIIALISIFLTWEDINVNELWHKIFIMLFIIIFSFLFSFIWIIFVCKTKRIWSQGRNKVIAIYGDLFKIAFKKNKESRIIVIPVNDTFETKVENAGEKLKKPLVAENSNHGRWIKQFCKENDISHEELNIRIQENLSYQGYVPIKTYSIEEKGRGNLKSYKLGTTAIIDGKNNVTFYLVAISTFDSNNNAQSSKKQIREAIEDLIDFYDKNGQSNPIFIPLMGTGKSRANMTHDQSFKLIKSCILTSDKKITGEMNIVVYTSDKDKVSIFR